SPRSVRKLDPPPEAWPPYHDHPPKGRPRQPARPASTGCGFAWPGCLKQEPGAPLRLVDPGFQQARAGDVAVLVAKAVRFAQAGRQLPVVVTQLGEHVLRRDEIGIVVQDALQPADVPDRAQGRAADLANTLGQRIRGGEDLVGMLVEE